MSRVQSPSIHKSHIQSFNRFLISFYKKHKRDHLPWRKTKNPYHILVSEVMLQQTQVSRVIPKYKDFIKKFPNVRTLASAPKAEVLTLWQGLGYNRRALFLKKTCEELCAKNSKRPEFPRTQQELISLPGIGQSTAGAILAFAYNIPQAFIETNIRSVFLYHFFKESSSVSDTLILELVDEAIDKQNPREWYYALYDYGTHLKEQLGKEKTNLHKKSSVYTKQSTFKGSNREIRSFILKLLVKQKQDTSTEKNKDKMYLSTLIDTTVNTLPQATEETVLRNIKALYKEGFIEEHTRKTKQGAVLWYTLSTT